MSALSGVKIAVLALRRRDPAGLRLLVDQDRRRRTGRPARHARRRSRCCADRSRAPSPGSSPASSIDVTTLGTLGLTSLLLTLAGYWAGRYGETTGRGRVHAPLVATVAATVFVELGGYVLDSLLGGPV